MQDNNKVSECFIKLKTPIANYKYMPVYEWMHVLYDNHICGVNNCVCIHIDGNNGVLNVY